MLSRGPNLIPPEAGRGTKHSPCFSEMLIAISFSENVEQRYNIDAVVMKFGLAMQHRLLSFGEKEG